MAKTIKLTARLTGKSMQIDTSKIDRYEELKVFGELRMTTVYMTDHTEFNVLESADEIKSKINKANGK